MASVTFGNLSSEESRRLEECSQVMFTRSDVEILVLFGEFGVDETQGTILRANCKTDTLFGRMLRQEPFFDSSLGVPPQFSRASSPASSIYSSSIATTNGPETHAIPSHDTTTSKRNSHHTSVTSPTQEI
eukprot:c439_g1_i1.p1 GENE.c439_g1_i1~~c439_g1_i1.p1  ORF type:complete len:130 (-),score=19.70 c439_g1_i1:133-522(-)